MLYTGAARIDVVKLGWSSIVKGRLTYVRQKTARSNGMTISHPDPFITPKSSRKRSQTIKTLSCRLRQENNALKKDWVKTCVYGATQQAYLTVHLMGCGEPSHEGWQKLAQRPIKSCKLRATKPSPRLSAILETPIALSWRTVESERWLRNSEDRSDIRHGERYNIGSPIPPINP